LPIEKKEDIAELLNNIAYLFKSSAYQEECEVRLVVQGVGFEKIIDTSCLSPKVYIELIELTPVLYKVTLGPKVEKAEEWAAAFNYHIKKRGYKADIVISHLPFK
jgi:hypothetical protein